MTQRGKPLSEINSTKLCSACGCELPLSAFYRKSDTRDGRHCHCKECKKARDREYYEANQSRLKAQAKRYREENADSKREVARIYYQANKERIKARVRQRAKQDPERKRAEDQAYYQANRDRIIEQSKQWRLDNPERRRLQARLEASKRRAVIRSAEGSYTADDIEQMYLDQNGLCAYCECELSGEYEIDHVIPLSRGGHNDVTNIAVACPPCNRSKFTKTAEEFMDHQKKGA